MDINVIILKIKVEILKYLSHLGTIFSPYKGYVLMYHSIEKIVSDENDICKCGLKDFEFQLLTFIKKGFIFITTQEYQDLIRKKEHKKFCILTFDDAYENVYTNAFPVLKRLDIPFVIFLTYNKIGEKGMLNENEINIMKDSGLCTIGAHTMSHPFLSNIRNLDLEIKRSKERLEKLFNIDINVFAYPYGQPYVVGNKAIKNAKHIFNLCFSAYPLPINIVTSKIRSFLPRIVPTNHFFK